MEINIPEYVQKVLNRLEDAGFEAYMVGGCVRDLILNRRPNDYDVTTSATPDEIQELFKNYKTLYVGKRFGTIVIIQPEGEIEVTTYRKEGKYIDGRRPSEVTFSKNINEDLSRRDFTINSIAYNKNTGIVDPYNGMKDLELRIIRTVGDPSERLNEDYLRILRAVRFSTQLDFSIEENTYKACEELSNHINHISAERIKDEIFKILLSKRPSKGIRLMEDMGLLNHIIPELIETIGYDQKNPHHSRTLYEHILCVVDNTPPVLEVRMAALLHDIAKPLTFSVDEKGVGHYFGHDKLGAEISKDILYRLKCSKDFTDIVSRLIREHMHHSNMKEKGLKRQLRRVGQANIFNLFELKKADMKCKNGKKDVSVLDEKIRQIENILKNHEPYEKSHLKIDGDDIIALGFSKGKQIGEILDYLTEKVLDNPEYNNKDKLIELVRNKYKKIDN
jgi:tRNA nucleotidyltransferase (CCA-adding enzyme)